MQHWVVVIFYGKNELGKFYLKNNSNHGSVYLSIVKFKNCMRRAIQTFLTNK